MIKPPGLDEKVAILNASMSKELPIIYVIKDKKCRFKFITDIAAQHTGAASSEELIDLTIRDVKCDAANFADDFIHYHEMCIEQRSEMLLLSLIHSAKGAMISLITNKPLINDSGEIEGVETWAQVLPSFAGLDKIIKGYHNISLDNTSNISPDAQTLTLREQECVHYLTRGFTFLEIAKKLQISSRTVETHITNIKKKLNVQTRAELIVKVCDLGYLEINPITPNLKPGKLQLLDIKPSDQLSEFLIDHHDEN